MLPDADKMIADVPGAMRRKCLDAAGGWHPCVLTQTQLAPQLSEYGIEIRGTTDMVYVARPFVVPADERLTIEDGGTVITRRIATVEDNLVFLVITLGEAC